ncbi:hypothetical protein VOA_000519 [Vibrio sp. RC586]|uniref:WD40 repeat domain-containing protein n=1 Tax=Vibrio sp. RC586 TaxID=675815 RepID=UPI0001BB7DA0|nr:WD40 repeat domain-containing protein [Vibrio sp. RC586]EEZ00461.1 hypothetical protein VOA_000519 [Vibrio sp. RC586]
MKLFLFLIGLCLSSQAWSEQRYVDGARWAFVSDAQSHQLAVIDTFTKKHIDTLTLGAVPSSLVVSDIQDLLVYIDGKTPSLFLYDLSEKQHSQMALSFVPDQLAFHPDGAQLAVGGRDKLIFVMPLTKKMVGSFAKISSPFSLNFDSGGYNLYITEQNTGNTFIYRFHDGQQTQLQFAKGTAVSEITLSPDSRLGMVAQYEDNTVYIQDLFMGEPFSAITLSAKPQRPYVSSDSEHIILAADNGEGVVVNAWSGEKVRDIHFGQNPSALRSGWLESIGIVAAQDRLTLFDIQSQKSEQQVALKAPLLEVVVVSDSKTLFATQQNTPTLFVYDIRTAQALAPIETGLKQPLYMVMGITNTICH